MNILAFESSCDETAVAVVRDGRTVLSDAILSQADMHALYGGVVPEIASRKHVEAIAGLTDQALADAGLTKSGVDAVASASYTTLDGEAVGRVQALAERIQQNVGGDLFSIRTSVVYPADGGELIDYAAQEQEENARPELTTHIENLDGYDTIFIGYPNWLAYHKLIQCTQIA